MGPAGSRTEQFYRFSDAEGRLHIVSSLEAVPPAARKSVEIVVLNADVTKAEQTVGPPVKAPPFELQGASFGVGFAAALVLALIFRAMPQDMRWMPKLAILTLVGVLGGGLYFGYLHKMSGANPDAGPLASPTSLIDDARRTVDQVKNARKRQDDELRAIENEARR